MTDKSQNTGRVVSCTFQLNSLSSNLVILDQQIKTFEKETLATMMRIYDFDN